MITTGDTSLENALQSDELTKETNIEERHAKWPQEYQECPPIESGTNIVDLSDCAADLSSLYGSVLTLLSNSATYSKLNSASETALTDSGSPPKILSTVFEKLLKNDVTIISPHLRSLSSTILAAHLLDIISVQLHSTEWQPRHEFSSRIWSETGHYVRQLLGPGFHSSKQVHFDESKFQSFLHIIRYVLHLKYPALHADGFRSLYLRPPMIYIPTCNEFLQEEGTTMSSQQFADAVCWDLNLPADCVRLVPLNSNSNDTISVTVLEEMIKEDEYRGKQPCIVFAKAGSEIMGLSDDLPALRKICTSERIWLHLDGIALALLLSSQAACPTLTNAHLADSVTVNPLSWIDVTSSPCCTIFRNQEAQHSKSFKKTDLAPLPLWICMQSVPLSTFSDEITHKLTVAAAVKERLSAVKYLRVAPSIVVTSPAVHVVLFHLELQTQRPDVPASIVLQNHGTELLFCVLQSQPGLNSFALDIVSVEGVECIRFHPFHSRVKIEEADVENMIKVTSSEADVLQSIFVHRSLLNACFSSQPGFHWIEKSDFNLGSFRYIPSYVEAILPLQDIQEDLDVLNAGLAGTLIQHDQHIHSVDGQASPNHHCLFEKSTAQVPGFMDPVICITMGAPADKVDAEFVLNLVALIKIVAENQEKGEFSQRIADIVKTSLKIAEAELHEESQRILNEQGLLRRLPVIGTLYDWLIPGTDSESEKIRMSKERASMISRGGPWSFSRTNLTLSRASQSSLSSLRIPSPTPSKLQQRRIRMITADETEDSSSMTLTEDGFSQSGLPSRAQTPPLQLRSAEAMSKRLQYASTSSSSSSSSSSSEDAANADDEEE